MQADVPENRMSITAAERQVRIDRRRLKVAPRGRKQEALLRLKLAVTAALNAAKDRAQSAAPQSPLSTDRGGEVAQRQNASHPYERERRAT